MLDGFPKLTLSPSPSKLTLWSLLNLNGRGTIVLAAAVVPATERGIPVQDQQSQSPPGVDRPTMS